MFYLNKTENGLRMYCEEHMVFKGFYWTLENNIVVLPLCWLRRAAHVPTVRA